MNIQEYILKFVEKTGIRKSARIFGVSPSAVCLWSQRKAKPNIKVVQTLIDNGEITVKDNGKVSHD